MIGHQASTTRVRGWFTRTVYRSEFIWRVCERERYEWIQKCPRSGKEWNVLLFKKGIARSNNFLEKWRRKNTLWYPKSSNPMRRISSVIYGGKWRTKITKYQKVKLLPRACSRHRWPCFEWKRSRCMDKFWKTNRGIFIFPLTFKPHHIGYMIRYTCIRYHNESLWKKDWIDLNHKPRWLQFHRRRKARKKQRMRKFKFKIKLLDPKERKAKAPKGLEQIRVFSVLK